MTLAGVLTLVRDIEAGQIVAAEMAAGIELAQHYAGEALVSAVDGLYLAEGGPREAALLAIFGRAETEPWFAARLRAHPAPGEGSCRRRRTRDAVVARPLAASSMSARTGIV